MLAYLPIGISPDDAAACCFVSRWRRRWRRCTARRCCWPNRSRFRFSPAAFFSSTYIPNQFTLTLYLLLLFTENCLLVVCHGRRLKKIFSATSAGTARSSIASSWRTASPDGAEDSASSPSAIPPTLDTSCRTDPISSMDERYLPPPPSPFFFLSHTYHHQHHTFQPLSLPDLFFTFSFQIDPKPCNPRTLQKPKRSGGFPKVFLGGLPSNVTETDLRSYFQRFGKVMEVVIMYDQEKKKSRGNFIMLCFTPPSSLSIFHLSIVTLFFLLIIFFVF